MGSSLSCVRDYPVDGCLFREFVWIFEKKETAEKAWKLRYCILFAVQLVIFKSSDSGSVEIGRISVSNLKSTIQLVPNVLCSKTNCINIITSDSVDQIIISCRSEEKSSLLLRSIFDVQYRERTLHVIETQLKSSNEACVGVAAKSGMRNLAGDQYTGDVDNNSLMMHGNGFLLKSDASKINGTWSYDRMDGYCSIDSGDGRWSFAGNYSKGNRDGRGLLKLINSVNEAPEEWECEWSGGLVKEEDNIGRQLTCNFVYFGSISRMPNDPATPCKHGKGKLFNISTGCLFSGRFQFDSVDCTFLSRIEYPTGSCYFGLTSRNGIPEGIGLLAHPYNMIHLSKHRSRLLSGRAGSNCTCENKHDKWVRQLLDDACNDRALAYDTYLGCFNEVPDGFGWTFLSDDNRSVVVIDQKEPVCVDRSNSLSDLSATGADMIKTAKELSNEVLHGTVDLLEVISQTKETANRSMMEYHACIFGNNHCNGFNPVYSRREPIYATRLTEYDSKIQSAVDCDDDDDLRNIISDWTKIFSSFSNITSEDLLGDVKPDFGRRDIRFQAIAAHALLSCHITYRFGIMSRNKDRNESKCGDVKGCNEIDQAELESTVPRSSVSILMNLVNNSESLISKSPMLSNTDRNSSFLSHEASLYGTPEKHANRSAMLIEQCDSSANIRRHAVVSAAAGLYESKRHRMVINDQNNPNRIDSQSDSEVGSFCNNFGSLSEATDDNASRGMSVEDSSIVVNGSFECKDAVTSLFPISSPKKAWTNMLSSNYHSKPIQRKKKTYVTRLDDGRQTLLQVARMVANDSSRLSEVVMDEKSTNRPPLKSTDVAKSQMLKESILPHLLVQSHFSIETSQMNTNDSFMKRVSVISRSVALYFANNPMDLVNACLVAVPSLLADVVDVSTVNASGKSDLQSRIRGLATVNDVAGVKSNSQPIVLLSPFGSDSMGMSIPWRMECPWHIAKLQFMSQIDKTGQSFSVRGSSDTLDSSSTTEPPHDKRMVHITVLESLIRDDVKSSVPVFVRFKNGVMCYQSKKMKALQFKLGKLMRMQKVSKIIQGLGSFLDLERCCVTCGLEAARVMVVPCCHVCLCDDCSRLVSRCPICNKRAEKKIRVFR